jgi:hypothetical protein
MASGPRVFCARSDVAVKDRANGQSARIRAARACPPELRQRVGILPDADLDVDRLSRLGVVSAAHKRPVHLGGVVQAPEIDTVADDQLHNPLRPRFSLF